MITKEEAQLLLEGFAKFINGESISVVYKRDIDRYAYFLPKKIDVKKNKACKTRYFMK